MAKCPIAVPVAEAFSDRSPNSEPEVSVEERKAVAFCPNVDPVAEAFSDRSPINIPDFSLALIILRYNYLTKKQKRQWSG